MKTYRLTVPAGMSRALLRPEISVPSTERGSYMCDWWKAASEEHRAEVVAAGEGDGNYLAAWEKVAAEILEKASPKTNHDLLSTISRLEAANDAKGNDSTIGDPGRLNTSTKDIP